MAKKVLICYDRQDARYKDLLKAWNTHSDYDFEFEQYLSDISIDADNAIDIQTNLIKKMKESEYILVIIGGKSYNSKWMQWEIQTAKQPDIKLKFAAVKLDRNFINPENIPIPATSFAYSFTMESVINSLKQARNRY